MKLNVPPKVRAGLYIFTTLGSPVIVFLRATNVIDDLVVNLWLSEVAAVSAMAAFNTDTTEEK